jgi:hypothetical protein
LFKTRIITTMSNTEHALLGMGYVTREQDASIWQPGREP